MNINVFMLKDVMVKTYVLVGNDHNGAFTDDVTAFSKNSNTVILHAKPGESLTQTLSQIEGDANIVLAAHGAPNGTFEWHKGDTVSYKDLFAKLPREGIQTVTVEGCYGESAISHEALSHAPKNAAVYPLVGKQSVGYSNTDDLAWHGNKINTDRMSLGLRSIDNQAPERVAELNAAHHKKTHEYVGPSTAEDVIPTTIGIADGKDGQVVYLPYEMDMIAIKVQQAKLDPLAASRALTAVKNELVTKVDGSGVHKENQIALINSVADKVFRQNKTPENAQEQRIAHALAYAYLETSGELDSRIENGIPRMKSSAQVREQAKDVVAPENVHFTQDLSDYNPLAMINLMQMKPQHPQGPIMEPVPSPLANNSLVGQNAYVPGRFTVPPVQVKEEPHTAVTKPVAAPVVNNSLVGQDAFVQGHATVSHHAAGKPAAGHPAGSPALGYMNAKPAPHAPAAHAEPHAKPHAAVGNNLMQPNQTSYYVPPVVKKGADEPRVGIPAADTPAMHARHYNGITDTPVMKQNQVEGIQKALVAGGMDVGKAGIDGKLGKDTIAEIGKVAKAAGVKVSDIDFTNGHDPELKAFNHQLAKQQKQGVSQGRA